MRSMGVMPIWAWPSTAMEASGGTVVTRTAAGVALSAVRRLLEESICSFCFSGLAAATNASKLAIASDT